MDSLFTTHLNSLFIAFVSEQPLGKFPLNVTLRMVDKEN